MRGAGMLGNATSVFKGERPAAVDEASTADMRSKQPEARVAEPASCAQLRAASAAAAPLAQPEDIIKGIRDSLRDPRGASRGSAPSA